MKFLKKLVLANITSSGAISHYHSTDFAYTDTFLSYCLRNLEKLTYRLNKYLLIRKRAHSLKQEFYHLKQKMINARLGSFKKTQVIDWAPLIKATPPLRDNSTHSKDQADYQNHYQLAGRSVLCVGGHIKLYPKYNQLIKSFGGDLMTFHGDSNDHLDNLPQLLEESDLIICPIDCVNHEAFLIVKYYCKYSGKPCVLLDRSGINTFCTGIHRLININSVTS